MYRQAYNQTAQEPHETEEHQYLALVIRLSLEVSTLLAMDRLSTEETPGVNRNVQVDDIRLPLADSDRVLLQKLSEGLDTILAKLG